MLGRLFHYYQWPHFARFSSIYTVRLDYMLDRTGWAETSIRRTFNPTIVYRLPYCGARWTVRAVTGRRATRFEHGNTRVPARDYQLMQNLPSPRSHNALTGRTEMAMCNMKPLTRLLCTVHMFTFPHRFLLLGSQVNLTVNRHS
jgi:hypothetical protein